MIRPAAKHTLEAIAGIMGVCALGGIVLACKLASGPISLKFLAPTVAAFLSRDVGDYRVDVKDAIMSWSPSEHALELHIVGVDFLDRAGTRVAGIPDMEIGLAMTGWKAGIVAPTSISLDHASAIIERDITGAFSIGAPTTGDKAGQGSLLPVVLTRLLSSSSRGTHIVALSELSIKDADLTLIDHRTGAVIHAPASRLTLEHTDKGLVGHMEAPAEVAGERFAITLDGTFDDAARTGAIDAQFSPVRLSRLAKLSDFYSGFAPFDIAVGGHAHLTLGSSGVITKADLALNASGGSYIPAGNDVRPVPVQSAAFNGTYWPKTGLVAIQNLSFEASGNHAVVTGRARLTSVEGKVLQLTGFEADLDARNIGIAWPSQFPEPIAIEDVAVQADIGLGTDWHVDLKSLNIARAGAKLDLSGTIAAADRSPAVKIDGRLIDFEIADLAKLWPIGLREHARIWVTRHVRSGLLTKGVLKIDAPGGALAANTVDENLMRFDFHIDNGVAEYVLKMPPLSDASGDMVLTSHTFSADLSRGKVLSAELTRGHVSIPDLGEMGSPIEITAQGHGGITGILRVLDSEPLKVVTKFGLAPEDASGQATFNLSLTIPQQSNIPEQDISYHAVAKGEGVKVKGLIPNLALDNGMLNVDVTQAGLVSDGTFTLNGAPTDIVWHQKFHDHRGKPTKFSIKTTLDDGARAGLGFDSGSYVTGPVGVEATLVGEGRHIDSLSGKVDLTNALIDLNDYNWSKPAGIPAKAALNVTVAKNGEIDVKTLSATGKGIDIDGRAALAKDGRLLSASFPHMRLDGLSDLAVDVDRQHSDELTAHLEGKFLDLGPFLKQALEDTNESGKLAWRVEANLDSATLRHGVQVKGFKATIASAGKGLTALDAKGAFSDTHDFSANLTQSAEGVRWLIATSNDAGRVIKGIAGIDSFLGGRLSLNVRLADAKTAKAIIAPPPPAPPATGGASALPTAPPAQSGTPQPSETASLIPPRTLHAQSDTSGVLKIDDFKIVNAPILAKLLTVGSLQGISDLLNGEGIEFAHLEMPFWFEKGRLGIEDARASGPAIGITLQGVIDRRRKLTDLNGTIVPAYTLNSMLGNVPVLGQLLVSRPGEGIFGFTYNVAGGIDEPKVMVNPLSALAPGFLRRLFELGETQAGALRTAPPATAQ